MTRDPLGDPVERLVQLRAEAMVRKVYGTFVLGDDNQIPVRTGTVVHRSGFSYEKPGAYFPVTYGEVVAARQRAFRCGVTFRSWMNWQVLRRNYEADPTDIRSGAFRKVRRAPPPAMMRGLSMLLLRTDTSMLCLADKIDELERAPTEFERFLRREIGWHLADMCAPLEPKRRRWRKVVATTKGSRNGDANSNSSSPMT